AVALAAAPLKSGNKAEFSEIPKEFEAMFDGFGLKKPKTIKHRRGVAQISATPPVFTRQPRRVRVCASR
ncbi:MAG: hypothetical protein IKD37_03720, partial [Clostridia bacterium]|nr:hypothetical protein [Clostridia bacterium]